MRDGTLAVRSLLGVEDVDGEKETTDLPRSVLPFRMS